MPIPLDPAEAEEAPYQGRVGATRTEQVHVPMPDRTLRTVKVHRAVNVATDPHLREPALHGTLHRIDESIDLAIPFVYHDPARRKLALVLPESMRHEELRERAKLLEAVAADTSVPVPRYVSEATVVVGLAQLHEYLHRPSRAAETAARRAELEDIEQKFAQREQALAAREQALLEREQALAQREQALARREQRMRERAEDVTRREDELQSSLEMHEAAQRDLAMREQELEQRLEALQQRERELAARAAELDRQNDAPPLLERSRAGASRPPSRPPPPEDVEEIEDLEPIHTSPGAIAESLGEASASPLPGGRIALADDAVEELVDDEDVEEEVDEADLTAEQTDGVGRSSVVAAGDAAPLEEASGPSTDPGLARPRELAGEAEMIARATPDGVDLFVALGEQREAFAGGADLLLQLVVVEGTPVVLLSLVDADASSSPPLVRRAVLDPASGNDRRVMELLRRRFEARTLFFEGDARTASRTGRVASPRELNAARVLDRIARLRPEGMLDRATAIARALSAPPPVAGQHPFAADDDRAGLDDAAATAAALAELADWASPEKMDHALLVLSVPRDAIDATFARVLERAIAHGLALPSPLFDRALAAGLASDAGALVARQIEAFRATMSRPDRGRLDDESIATNWERLFAAAADAEVAIDSDTHDLGWRAIRAVRGEQTGSIPGGAIDAERLVDMGAPELVMLLEHPRHRRAAALALCERGDPAFAEVVCKAVRKMPRAEVVRVVPRITRLGDEAGDALIDGLSARKTFVRQAFALALGHLKLRRAVVPLLHLLASEPSDVWREVARVYGSFGQASFRTLAQKLQDAKAPRERYVRTLSHLANHGCASQIEALEKDADPRIAQMAREARSLREEARRHEESVAGKRPLEGADPVLAFSRRFYEELEGTAPEADLAEEG